MENEHLRQLKNKANKLPKNPGVYIMKDKAGEIIYIGKAKALKNRVTQYFGSGNGHTEKVRQMVSHVNDFEYIICDSEFEALVLESSLIKQNQPKYNILLKDDKGYHYILITADKWQKIEIANNTDKKGEYIGPYYSSFVVRDTVDCVNKIFKLPDCNRSFDRPSKPCLNFHIGKCFAPCKGNISFGDYKDTIESAVGFIKNGDATSIIPSLKEKMQKASDRLDFEYAAKLRDRINAITKLSEKQKVVMCKYKSQDVFAAALLGETACVSVLNFRNSRLTDKNHYFIEGVTDKKSFYGDFLEQYYLDKIDIPSRILLDNDFDGKEILNLWLNEKADSKVKILVPKAGEQREIMAMCAKNASENLSEKSKSSGKEMSALNELSKYLGLKGVPRFIESYDISHTSGEENVAAMIVFKDGLPLKSAYRRFKIKSFSGADDYRSMAEVMDRRLTEYEKGEDTAFSRLPDLILLDGGIGQINAVLPVINKHNIKIPVFGMVKDSKHKTRAIASDGGDISISSNRSAFILVNKIQEEVHRFAITYHRNLRSKKMLDSELTKIGGIGKEKAKSLMLEFKSIERIKNASVKELETAKGISLVNAKKIYDYFHNN
ncbi:MAG: excinuclease ABC subunit UvrC [Clostridia bacterium]|nr:excinuclease ABC subunit UvrC [Clostridia bacterium]